MRLLVIVCASVAVAAGAGGCTSGDAGIRATTPFDPFGGEAAPISGSEPTGGAGNESPSGAASLTQLCAGACANIASTCAGNSNVGPNCAADCAASGQSSPACATQFKAFVACLATAPLSCLEGAVTAPSCDGLAAQVSACRNPSQPPAA
jgi:hypothetical protein